MSHHLFMPALIATIVISASPTFAQSKIVRIDEPKIEGKLLDWCLQSGDKCGQPAADAFCRASGHRRSLRFVQWIDPNKPTQNISDGTICDASFCDSFRWIECKTKS